MVNTIESFLQLNSVKLAFKKMKETRVNIMSRQLKVLSVIRRKCPSFYPVCIGCLLHSTIQLVVERSVLHYICSSELATD